MVEQNLTPSNNTEYDKKRIVQLNNEISRLESVIEHMDKKKGKSDLKRDREFDLKPFQAELIRLQKFLEDTNTPMMVLFEGRDASGKGGTIRRVTRYMNEKHYRVVALDKPTEPETTQWYFQRYINHFPYGGEMVLFDRSWYNRAMVEPVLKFCTRKQYDNFFKSVNPFEQDLVRNGTILVKLYFSVTKEEQERRFQRRTDDPLRQWKLSEVDRQAQEYWHQFTAKKYNMLSRASTSKTPWHVIRSDCKHDARLNAMRVLLNSVPGFEVVNKDIDIKPDSEIVLSGSKEVEHMRKKRDPSAGFNE